jgi:hypothetical protein
MLNSDLDEYHWVILCPYTGDMYLISGDLLVLLAQNGENIPLYSLLSQ